MMTDFNQIRKNQRFSYKHMEGAPTYKLKFIRTVRFGDELTLLCKVQGLKEDEWYKQVYLTRNDFIKKRARAR